MQIVENEENGKSEAKWTVQLAECFQEGKYCDMLKKNNVFDIVSINSRV